MKIAVSLRTRFVIIRQPEDFAVGSFNRCLIAVDSEIDGNSNAGCYTGIGNGASAESVANSLGLLYCFAKKDARRLAFSAGVEVKPVSV